MIKFFPELRRPRSDGLASALGLQDYRDPFEIQFGLFGDDDAGGGSDNVDRSNPNEMAAREKAAARAGTVTDGSGNPVTSINADGSRSVVTTGTQAQQVAAREAFNATDPRASDTRSNYAQDQYDQVRAQEDAALQRAAAAGRLASAPASSALANVGDVTQAQYGPFASDQPQLNFVAPQISRPEVNFSATSPMTLPEPSPIRGVVDTGVSSGLLARQLSSDLASPEVKDSAARQLLSRSVSGDAEATELMTDAQNRGEFPGLIGPTRTVNVPVGIMNTPAATAASVLQGTTTPASDFLVGQQSSVGRPGLVGTAADGSPITTDEFQSVYVDGRGMSVPRPEMSVINTAAADPMTQLSQQQAIFGLGDNAPQSATSAAAQQAAARQLSPLEQSVQAAVDASTRTPEEQAGVTPTELMGQQAAAGTPAESFYTDAYRGVYPDVAGTVEDPKGNIPGTTMAGIGNAVKSLPGIGTLLSGGPQDLPPASEQAAFNSGQLLSLPGATIDEQTGAISGAKAGRGTLNMNRFGMVTYSGMPDPSYDGPYANLVNPPADTGGDGGQPMQQATADPCPEGYQMVDGVCTPVDGVTVDEPAAPGSDFVINPTTGLPTLFQPTTQATQVGQINPFVLQPYTPMQAQNIQQARSGIQALSPTGAALGRQV